jgi:predicted RNase H-like nuclease (RuvC/YqgF family)
MDGVNWATIIVGIFTVLGAIFTGISASRASKYSTKTQAETEAYSRARKMDVETIERQDKEIEELHQKYAALKVNEERLNQDNDRLRRRLTRLEQKLEELGVSLD